MFRSIGITEDMFCKANNHFRRVEPFVIDGELTASCITTTAVT